MSDLDLSFMDEQMNQETNGLSEFESQNVGYIENFESRIHRKQLLAHTLAFLEFELSNVNKLILIVEESLPIDSEDRELFAQSNVNVNSLVRRTQKILQRLVNNDA